MQRIINPTGNSRGHIDARFKNDVGEPHKISHFFASFMMCFPSTRRYFFALSGYRHHERLNESTSSLGDTSHELESLFRLLKKEGINPLDNNYQAWKDVFLICGKHELSITDDQLWELCSSCLDDADQLRDFLQGADTAGFAMCRIFSVMNRNCLPKHGKESIKGIINFLNEYRRSGFHDIWSIIPYSFRKKIIRYASENDIKITFRRGR